MRSFLSQNVWADATRTAAAPYPSEHVDALVLAANTAESTEIPTGAAYVVFGGPIDANFYVSFVDENDTGSVPASVPGSDVADGTAGAMNPIAFRIPEWATHISIAADDAAVVTLSYYAG